MNSPSSLSADRRLHFDAAACLAARSAGAACSACTAACPTAALRVADSPALVGACLGCGRCAAACPTGAIQANGFDPEVRSPNGNRSWRVECWMVPRSLCARDSLRVPCVGGVSPGRWLTWVEAAGDARIEVIDHGWCANCPAGAAAAGHPAAATLDTVRSWLLAAGMAPAALPGIVNEPLPAVLRPAELPGAANAETLSRRGFFGRLAERARAPLQAPVPRTVSVAAARRIGHAQPEHDMRIAVLTRLAHRHGGRVHAEVLPSIVVGAGCDGCAVCARACPTGALRLATDEAAAGLAFDATRCVACGLCAGLCPEQAIGFAARHCGPTTPTVVRRHELRDCPECGAAHAGTGALCPRCAAGRDMAFDLFSPAGPGLRNSRSSAEVTHHE